MKHVIPTNISRLTRMATLLMATAVGAFVYSRYQAPIAALERRIADAEAALRSEEVAASEMLHLREERDALAARYARLLTQNAEAVFLSELMSVARARGLTLVTTSLSRASTPRANGTPTGHFEQTHATVELRGSYRDLLIAISELSTGSEIVAVEPPSLRRDGEMVIASVPVTIYEPTFAIDHTP